MTQAGIPLGHLVTSAQRWAKHLHMPGLRPLPGIRWKMPESGEGVLTPGLVVPQLPNQVIFRDLSADGKAGEGESAGKKKGEGRGRGRCGGWSETKNVSTSGRNSSLSEAVWLSQVCMTELPEHFTSRVLFPCKSKKADYTCPALLTSDPI